MSGSEDKTHVIETTIFIEIMKRQARRAGDANLKVSSTMLLKTQLENMSETGLSTISMKTRHIEDAFHDIHDK